MDLTKQFLTEDLHKALKEYICIMNCRYIQNEALESLDYKTARIMSENITRSLKELERLQEKKEVEDKLNQLKTMWVELKIDASALGRLGR